MLKDMVNAIENETKVTLLHITSDDLSKYDDVIHKDLKTIPGTMQIHPPADVYLYCHHRTPRHELFLQPSQRSCNCYDPKLVTFSGTSDPAPVEDRPTHNPTTATLLNQCVTVIYDNKPYPGVVDDVEHETDAVKSVYCIRLDGIGSSGPHRMTTYGTQQTTLYQ